MNFVKVFLIALLISYVSFAEADRKCYDGQYANAMGIKVDTRQQKTCAVGEMCMVNIRKLKLNKIIAF